MRVNFRQCPNCKRTYIPDLFKTEDVDFKLTQHQAGGAIQNVWPEATAIQREQLQTGICSDKCWDEYLGGSDA